MILAYIVAGNIPFYKFSSWTSPCCIMEGVPCRYGWMEKHGYGRKPFLFQSISQNGQSYWNMKFKKHFLTERNIWYSFHLKTTSFLENFALAVCSFMYRQVYHQKTYSGFCDLELRFWYTNVIQNHLFLHKGERYLGKIIKTSLSLLAIQFKHKECH